MINYSEILSIITSSGLQEKLLFLKIIFIIISLIFIGFFILFLKKTKWLKLLIIYDLFEIFTLKIWGAKRAKKTLRAVKKIIAGNNERKYKKAVIMVDDSLGLLLERLVPLFQKNTFEERLDWLTESSIPNIEKIRNIHQLRRQIEENRNYQIGLDQVHEASMVYEEAIKELEII